MMIINIKFKNLQLTKHKLNMNRQDKLQLHDDLQRYLQKNNVYGIVQELMQNLLVQQPKEPLDFMISHLSKPQKHRILLIGPPGMRLYKVAEKVINENNSQGNQNKCVPFNCGEFVLGLKSELSPEENEAINHCRLIQSKSIEEKIIKQITNLHNSDSDCLIEGFPKSLQQALALQTMKFYPSKVIFVNVSCESLNEFCKNKIKQQRQNISEEELNELCKHSVDEYQINIKNLKKYYPTYLQIDGSLNHKEQQVSKQIKRCLGLEVKQLKPRKNTQILIIGSPKSGRTTLGKRIAQKYHLTYVSSALLISEQIRKDTVTGRKIKQKYVNNQLVDDFTIEKLIDERISKKDCQMQGFVLQGYPKTKDQWENIKNLRMHPNYIIGIDASQELIMKRFENRSEDLSKRFEKWNNFKKDIESEPSIFWLNPCFNADNSFEEVCFELQNRKRM